MHLKTSTSVALGIFVLPIIGFSLFLHFGNRSSFRDQHFQGVVISKRYSDAKPLPTISVAGYADAFCIGSYDFYNAIAPGDIIIKNRNTIEYQLVKPGNDTQLFSAHWMGIIPHTHE